MSKLTLYTNGKLVESIGGNVKATPPEQPDFRTYGFDSRTKSNTRAKIAALGLEAVRRGLYAYFWTLTTQDYLTDNETITNWVNNCRKQGLFERFCWVAEYTSAGRRHYHIFVISRFRSCPTRRLQNAWSSALTNTGHMTSDGSFRRGRDKRGYHNDRIPVDRVQAVANYCSKYMTKGSSKDRIDGKGLSQVAKDAYISPSGRRKIRCTDASKNIEYKRSIDLPDLATLGAYVVGVFMTDYACITYNRWDNDRAALFWGKIQPLKQNTS